MVNYDCRLADASGRVFNERRSAPDEASLMRGLAGTGLYLLSCTPEAERRAKSRRLYSEKTVQEFTKTLAVLLQAGLSLENALAVAQGAFPNGQARQLISQLLAGLRKGESFSQILDSLENTFPQVYRGMVRIGERTGKLEPMFVRISDYMDSQKTLMDKVKNALAYPILVLAVVGLLILGIVFFLLPKMQDLFGHMGSAMPHSIVRALALMNVMKYAILVMAIVIVAIVISTRAIKARGKKGGVVLDRYLLSLPGVGRFVMLRESLSFSFVMETLVAAGISLEDALDESPGVLRNEAMRADIRARPRGDTGGRGAFLRILPASLFSPGIRALGSGRGKDGLGRVDLRPDQVFFPICPRQMDGTLYVLD